MWFDTNVNIAELRTRIALNKEFTISKLKDSWIETCYLFQNVSIKNIIRFQWSWFLYWKQKKNNCYFSPINIKFITFSF